MTTQERLQWLYRGYADARATLGRDGSDTTPLYPRAPSVPPEVLYLCREQQDNEEVALYWQGFDSGIQDNVSHILRGAP